MTDEEWKAIEYLKQNNLVEIQYDNYGLESIHRVGIDEKQTILNLIEKQTKEIEELNKENTRQHELIGNIHQKWEDKIKAKIEPRLKELDGKMKKEWKEYGNSREYQDMEDEWNFLQSLLEKE